MADDVNKQRDLMLATQRLGLPSTHSSSLIPPRHLQALGFCSVAPNNSTKGQSNTTGLGPFTSSSKYERGTRISELTQAMASSTATMRSISTTENDDASHSDTAHIEQALAGLQVASNSGLENSPLGRLPAELRNKIFEMAFAHPTDRDASYSTSMTSFFSRLGTRRASTSCHQISWALNIMATCKQVRSETEGLLLSLNDIYIDRGELFLSLAQLKRSMPLLMRIPSSLGSDSGRVVLHLVCAVSRYRAAAGEELQKFSGPGLKRLLATSSQAIRPFHLFLDLDMRFHAWGGGDAQRNDVLICHKDVPVTLGDCGRIHNIIPADDHDAALIQIDEVVDSRLELLRRHCLHRLCPVRATLRQSESGLEESRQFMRDIVDRIFEDP